LKQNSSESRREWKDSVSTIHLLSLQSFSLTVVPDPTGHGAFVGEQSLRTTSNSPNVARFRCESPNPTAESTQDCSGNWALEPRYQPGSSVAPKSKQRAILVSCRRTLSHQRVWFSVGNASRSFGSGHSDPARGCDRKLRVKTRMVPLDPHPQRHAVGLKLEGGYC